MTALVLRLFWESQCILFFCAPHSPYPHLALQCFPKVCYSCRPGGKVTVSVWFLCCDGEMPCLHPHMQPECRFSSGRFGERPVLPRCRLMAAVPLHCCPRTPGSQRQTSPPSEDVRGEEQNDRICPFTKANLSVVPSVLQRHETQ